jgi:hypothetical protein
LQQAFFFIVSNSLASNLTYVVFGTTQATQIQLSDLALGSGGLLIQGTTSYRTGINAAAIGAGARGFADS